MARFDINDLTARRSTGGDLTQCSRFVIAPNRFLSWRCIDRREFRRLVPKFNIYLLAINMYVADGADTIRQEITNPFKNKILIL